jgi:hypothetical protein
MNKFLIGSVVALCGATAYGQILDPTISLDVDARFDYQYNVVDGKTNDDDSGFKGKYLNIQLSGKINSKFGYSWRQRLNKSSYDGSFFDATDWIYLDYMPNDNWVLSGGKQVVAIGGYEYDRAPINIFRGSEFWNNIPCYQFGVSGTYVFDGKRDKLMAQICTNPFRSLSNNNTYAYNLMWIGSHGFFNTLYSANLIEYRPGHYISYIALGHNFIFGNASLELDLMNRASSHQAFLFKDVSVMADLGYNVSNKVKVFAKATYDVNNTNSDADYTVMSGSEIKMVGAGVEYHPFNIKKQDIRFHACCFYSWGRNTNPDATLKNKNTFVDAGVTWYMNVVNTKK